MVVALPGAKELVGDLAHGLEVVPGNHKLLEVLRIIRDVVLLEVGLESLPVLVPVIDHGLLHRLDGGRDVRDLGRSGRVLPVADAVLRRVLALPLSTLGRVGAGGLSRRGRRAHVERAPIVIVYPSHVVLEVPLARESVSWKGAIASVVGAQVGLVSMAVHGVGFALMSEEARGRREAGVFARLHLASVGLQVRVDEFAGDRGG